MKTMNIMAVAVSALMVFSTPIYATGNGGNGNNNGPDFGGNSSANASATSVAGANASVTNSNKNTNTNLNSNTNVNSNVQGQNQGQVQGQLQGQSQSLSGNNSTSNVSIRDRKQAPGLAVPSMSSGHPCAYGGSFGVSFVGGAVSGGGNKVDNACMLYQSGQIDAANYMLAERDKSVCRALRAVGSISASSTCGEKPVATTSTRSTTSSVAYTSCKVQDGAIRVGVRAGASDETKALASRQCQAALR